MFALATKDRFIILNENDKKFLSSVLYPSRVLET